MEENFYTKLNNMNIEKLEINYDEFKKIGSNYWCYSKLNKSTIENEYEEASLI